jgi:hypothetical protein
VLRLMVNQIDQTIGSSKNVTLNANDVSYDNSDFQTAVENYNQLLKRTDLVILIGATVLRAFPV